MPQQCISVMRDERLKLSILHLSKFGVGGQIVAPKSRPMLILDRCATSKQCLKELLNTIQDCTKC